MKNKKLVLCGLFAAIIAVCSWITIPSAVPFTMQTFGIFSVLLILGGKYGTVAVFVYISIGAIGLPVFAGFKGGLGVILSPLGGYIIGFIALSMIYMIITKFFGERLRSQIAGLSIGLIICYLFGTVWYMLFVGETNFAAALTICVLPFIIPDILKMVLAVMLNKRIKNRIPS
ncbi:MAG: biotin transporter BioY [Oscillospiraceae bacterium]|nr:biotin transporter BioY [Oscillospiraceae bacterium]